MKYINVKVGVLLSIFSCILLLFFSGFLYDFLYEKLEPSIIEIDSDCKSISNLNFFVTIQDDGSITINATLSGDDDLIRKLIDDCSYLNINSEEQLTYVSISAKDEINNQSFLISQNINREIFGRDIVSYKSSIRICRECFGSISIDTAPFIFRKTYAVRLLKLRIYFFNKNKNDKILSNLYIQAPNESKIKDINDNTGENFPIHKKPSKYGRDTLIFPGKSDSMNANSDVFYDIDMSYSRPLDERLESAILNSLGMLISIGIGFVVQGGVEYFEFKQREREKRNHDS